MTVADYGTVYDIEAMSKSVVLQCFVSIVVLTVKSCFEELDP